jgi:CcmD family protein
MTGVVEGGWGYVIAAYATTWLFFLGYTASLIVRRASAEKGEE